MVPKLSKHALLITSFISNVSNDLSSSDIKAGTCTKDLEQLPPISAPEQVDHHEKRRGLGQTKEASQLN